MYANFSPFLTPAADHLLKHVAGWKREIIQRLSLEKNIVFIGVHNRRADWAQHYQVVDGSSVLVDEVHFNAAFEIYRYLLYFVRLCSANILTGKNTMMIKTKLCF